MDIGLIKQSDLLVEGLEARFDDLLDHVCRLAGVLLREYRAFARNCRWVDPGGVERDRTCGGDMHRDLPPERAELSAIACGFKSDDDPNSAKPVSDRPPPANDDTPHAPSQAPPPHPRPCF